MAQAGLCRFVDAYVDRSAFSVEDATPVLSRALGPGLGLRVHVGQFADVGGAEMAGALGAATVDHLENVERAGIDALAAAGARAVLLPVASFTLKQRPPPVAAPSARRACASWSRATRTPARRPPRARRSRSRSPCRGYGLTVAEAVLGATREAAASLGLTDVTGLIRPGMRADLALWDLDHENALVQPWGLTKARCALRDGRPIAGALP